MKKNRYKLSMFLLCVGFFLSSFALLSTSSSAQMPIPSFQDDDGDDEPEPGDKKKKDKKKKKKKPNANDDDVDADGSANEPAKEPVSDAGVQDGGEKTSEPTPDAGTADRGEGSQDGSADAGATQDAGGTDTGTTGSVDAGDTDTGAGNDGTDAPVGTVTKMPPPPAASGSVTEIAVFNQTPATQSNLMWELRVVWGVVALLLLSWLLLFLHSMLPFVGLRFLSIGSFGLIRIATGALFLVLIYRLVKTGVIPGSTTYTGLLFFAFVALEAHIYRKKKMETVHFGAFALLLIAPAALVWALTGPIHVAAASPAMHTTGGLFSFGQFLMYGAFGLLATAGSWLFASGYLGLLAKGNKGTGYGLAPANWNQFQIQPGILTLIAFPILTLAWVIQVLWSLQFHGNPWQAWELNPRLWSVFFCWTMIAAYLFALRFPRKRAALESPDDDVLRTNKFPSFLLLIATLGGAVLFIGGNKLIQLLQGLG